MAQKSRPAWRVWSEYLLARMAAAGVNAFEPDAALATASAAARLYFSRSRRHRERAMHNVRCAFPTWDERRVEQVARESFEQFFKLAIEGLNTPRLIHRDSWAQRARFSDIGPTLRLLNSGRAVLLVTGHIGGFEAIGSVLAVLGYPIHAVARPIDNPLINDWLLGVRERRGMKVISKWQSEIERMFAVLEAGEILAIVADQNAGDRGMFVPFFGRLASTHKSLGLMAVERNVPIVCGYTRRLPPGCRYEVRVTDIIMPEDWADQDDPLFYITARFMRAVEAMVRESPTQYLWMHRRWKSRPRFEKQGKPMPASLRRKIESLPWMDQPTIERLLSPPPEPAEGS